MTDNQAEPTKNRDDQLSRRTVLRAGSVGLAGILGASSWATQTGVAASAPSGEMGATTVEDNASTASTTMIDEYDDWSLEAYDIEDKRSYGPDSYFKRGDSGYSLKWAANAKGFDYAVSTSGLEHYPAAGDTWEFFLRCSGVTDWQGDVHFCAQTAEDAPDSYSVRLTHSTLELEEWSGGSHLAGSRSSCSWPVDEWCRVEVHHEDTSPPTLTARAYDASGTKLGETSYTATNTYTSGGFGYRPFANNTDTVYIDDVRTVGSQTADSEWQTVSLDGSYDNPVVLVKPVSMESDHPVHTRVRNVSTNSFEYKLETWKYQNAKSVGKVHYAVVEAGTYTLPDGSVLEAGTTTVDDTLGQVAFDAAFPSSPVVFSQAQTYNDSEPIITRNRNVSADGFQLCVQEEEALGSHPNETVGYLAVQPTATSGYEIDRTAEAVTDQWHALSFEGSYDAPIFLADMQTTNGWQPAGLRHTNLSDSSVDIRAEEEQSEDDETKHIAEQVGYLVATPGSFFGSGGSDGSDTTGSGGSGSDSGGSNDESSYYDGATLYSSDYSSLQAAVNDASARDTVVVDADHTISSYVKLKSDLKVQGGGGTITFADGSNAMGLRPAGCQNVWIDGVHIDGNKANQAGDGHGIGGPSIGTISNIRVTNCVIEDCWGNGIEFNADEGGNTITDIYLGHNEIYRSGRHGIVLGVKGTAGGMSNVIYEGNYIDEVHRAQHLGYFGHQGVKADSCAIIGNETVRNGPEQKGTASAFEEIVHNSVMYGNDHHDHMGKAGPVVTKDGQYNLVANNRIRRVKHGVAILNFAYYDPDGPPTNNLVTHNDIAGCKNGMRLNNLNSGNVIHHNRIQNNENEYAGNSRGSQTFIDNGPDVSEADVGLPDSIGDGVTYETPGGQVGAEASWDRGSPHPDDPVQVNVDVYPDRY